MELTVNRTGVQVIAGAKLMPLVMNADNLMPVTRGVVVVTAPDLQR